MQYEEQKAIMPFLLSTESIVWTGKPQRGFLLRKSDAYLIPFSLTWGGFAFFWEYTAYKGGAPAFFLGFGGIFVVLGIYLIFGRFDQEENRLRVDRSARTHTDRIRRAIIEGPEPEKPSRNVPGLIRRPSWYNHFRCESRHALHKSSVVGNEQNKLIRARENREC